MDLNLAFDQYEAESFNKLVKIDIDNVDELNKQFQDFNSQLFKQRRNADDFSLALTGMTNQQRYELQMKSLTESELEITDDMIQKAKIWCADSNLAMVYPDEDLELVYNKYKTLPVSDQREADDKAIEIFGVDNETLYKILSENNNNVSLDDINKTLDDENSSYNIGKIIKTLESYEPKNNTDIFMINHIKKKAYNKVLDNSNKYNYNWEFIYSPFFTPKEIVEFDGYYSDEETDNEVNKLYDEYNKYFYGYNNSFDIIEWDKELRKNIYKLDITDNLKDKNKYKQNIIKLGWNPEIEYNDINKHNAKIRIESSINEMYKNISLLNLESAFDCFNESESILEARKEKLKPVSIVLVRGSSLFSDAIVKATKGPFSHAAICLDNDFERLYSFNLHHESNKTGGMSLESIKTFPKENRLAVFTFFVREDQWNKMSYNVQEMLNNYKDTKYSILNVITLPFKNININMNDKMICSQFVDKIIKLGDVNIANIDSSKVTPNYLYNISIKNSKIYKVYDGKVKDFNHSKATKFVNKLSKTAKHISESVFYNYTIDQYEYAILTEARQVPLEIKDNGDVLLNNPIVDFDREYYASHKILMQYEKANNTDSIKYELCRLYYMNYILEKRIYNNKFVSPDKRNEYIKTRARILNDFNKYLDFVLKKEPNFNFAKYYEESPFYANTVEIKGSTMRKLKDIMKIIL